MDYVGKTIAIPVWSNLDRVYVASADVPRGTWNLVFSLTPIQNHEFIVNNNEYWIDSVTLWDQKSNDVLKCTVNRTLKEGQGWLLILENSLPKDSTTPVPFRYTIKVAGPKQTSTRKAPKRSYDPVVIAQPDPIYP